MVEPHILVKQSLPLRGQAFLYGAKNAVLVTMASLILTDGTSVLTNVPNSSDVLQMIALLEQLGAQVTFNQKQHHLVVDTSGISSCTVCPDIMRKMRASILVMGPLLARFGAAKAARPGGCSLGARPIDFHLTNFRKMGAVIEQEGDFITARAQSMQACRLVLAYPSVGATENAMMAAALTKGVTTIVNAALEPEVMDLVAVLKKMGVRINILPPATIAIEGVKQLRPIEHDVVPDRLEAGALLLAGAITGGEVFLPNARAYDMDVFLLKLEQMGHTIVVGAEGQGVRLIATKEPKAVSFKTSPYPGFPTDLQAPMMTAQCVAQGVGVIEETVFENRLMHVQELQKMGAKVVADSYNCATVTGTERLVGASVAAPDIRSACALVLAGLVAQGQTIITGVPHWQRAHDKLEKKLQQLGANVELVGASELSLARGQLVGERAIAVKNSD